MGRTIPSITLAFLEEQDSLKRFRRALRKHDQQALDDLLVSARQHIAASGYAAYPRAQKKAERRRFGLGLL